MFKVKLLFFFSCHLFPYLRKSCLIAWQNWFINHYEFVSWHVQKSDLEKMPCVYLYVYIYVKTSENSSFCTSGIIRPIGLKFGVHHLKQTRPFFLYHFRQYWFTDCDFMTVWIFWKISVIAVAAANFKRLA